MSLTKLVKGNTIYLSMGSNLGDKRMHLTRAQDAIGQQVGDLLKASRIYQSEAWGYSSAHSFYNCSLSVQTLLEPLALLDALMSIEKSQGRIRIEGAYTDRVIDIDLLFYGDTIMEHPRLSLPHPAMGKRRFVLEPLAEIAPDLVHPLSGLTIMDMLEHCPDKAMVIPL